MMKVRKDEGSRKKRRYAVMGTRQKGRFQIVDSKGSVLAGFEDCTSDVATEECRRLNGEKVFTSAPGNVKEKYGGG